MGESIPKGDPHKNAEDNADMSYVEMAQGQGPYAAIDKNESVEDPAAVLGFPLHHEKRVTYIALWECNGDRNKFDDVVTELITDGRKVEGVWVMVKVKRTSGATENDWIINNYAPERKEFRVQKVDGPEGKWVSYNDLREQNL